MRKRHTNAVFLGDLRGRTAGEIVHLERIAAEVAASLAGARRNLEAIDRVIALFDPRIDPTTIPVIHSNKKIPRGPKGGLSLALKGILETAGPQGLSVREIGWALQLKHGLSFETPQEFTRYLENTLKCQLFDLKRQGILESFEELTTDEDATDKRTIKRWRLKKAGTSINSLIVDAKARGAEVMIVDAEALPSVTRVDLGSPHDQGTTSSL
jgi:hypothetical protein